MTFALAPALPDPAEVLTQAEAMLPSRGARVVSRLAELGRFSAVGTAAFLVDLSVYNLLRFGPGPSPHASALWAKVIAVVVATAVSWLGSRMWTFADRRTDRPARELASFLVVNACGMAISVLCLVVATDVLGLTSPLAENIAANGVGLLLANGFRYVAYRQFVFAAPVAGGAGPAAVPLPAGA